ncbi:SMR family transporter [Helicobacter sp. 13S00477-4]|uniref:SMR family transporter n=1 Tax=Helicobacter sp. 13S00477-4 TaxID=1905759 RepID=UPI000BD7175B|nr:SMR family transporter [Helicobacter sp. 13S00477-4]PAF51307.1 QacE family quaternary ammonium compound efflux SMR transporter [Helicobacter sp. 13S00477-4]
MYFVFLIIGAFLDVLANLLLKKSEGFKNKSLGITAIILVLGAFSTLSFTIQVIPLSIAYSIWGALGIIGTIIGGHLFFNERLGIIGWIGMLLVIISVILLSTS